MTCDQLSLAVRAGDPDTARAQARERGHVKAAIVQAFVAHGTLTDDELVSHVRRILCDPDLCAGTVKTLRSRLTKAYPALLVRTKERRRSNTGAWAGVYALHPSLRPTEEIRATGGVL